MAVEIVFETHATTEDNENQVSSGHHDVELSEAGLRQAEELGARYADDHFHAVFCSDLRRSYRTAEHAFGDRFRLVTDARLRECDYGIHTRMPRSALADERARRVTVAFPGGESYEQAASRVGDFLVDLLREYDGRRVMIIGHRATQYGLEHWLRGVPLAEAVAAPWEWRPGWTYRLGLSSHQGGTS